VLAVFKSRESAEKFAKNGFDGEFKITEITLSK
jgi:hypothetical protein